MGKSKLLLALLVAFVLLSVAGLIAIVVFVKNIIIIAVYLCIVILCILLFCALFGMEDKIYRYTRNIEGLRMRIEKLDLDFSRLELDYEKMATEYKNRAENKKTN